MKNSKVINWKPYITIAACFFLIAAAVFNIPYLKNLVSNKEYIHHDIKENHIVINQLNHAPTSVRMDIQHNSYYNIPEALWNITMDDFKKFTGITYNDLIKRIPASFEYTSFYSLSTRDGSLDNNYKLHDFVLEYLTESNGQALISLCSFEDPLKYYYINHDSPELSHINGAEVVIYSFESIFYTSFSHGESNFHIETSNIDEEDLIKLITGILTPDENISL